MAGSLSLVGATSYGPGAPSSYSVYDQRFNRHEHSGVWHFVVRGPVLNPDLLLLRGDIERMAAVPVEEWRIPSVCQMVTRDDDIASLSYS